MGAVSAVVVVVVGLMGFGSTLMLIAGGISAERQAKAREREAAVAEAYDRMVAEWASPVPDPLEIQFRLPAREPVR